MMFVILQFVILQHSNYSFVICNENPIPNIFIRVFQINSIHLSMYSVELNIYIPLIGTL